MKEDFNKLRLKYHNDPAMMQDILQRECRYKTTTKLQDTLKCKDFLFPSLSVAEMATSDDIAKIHASFIPDGARVLDMTFGLGIDSFHFAEKASEVIGIEYNHDTFNTGVHNCCALGLTNIRLIEGDSTSLLASMNEHFDVIFIDPARRDSTGRHFALQDSQPDIIQNLPLILRSCDRLIIKASPMLDIKKTVDELAHKCQVITIGTVKECKELVFIIDNPAVDSPGISHTTCITTTCQTFQFTPEEEASATPLYYTPQVSGEVLLEPFPSVMKGGGMKTLSERYNTAKLHPNTNLFTTKQETVNFPGEYFEIIDILPFNKQTVKTFAKNHPFINVAVRNFPLNAPQLAAKLKIKEGGNEMVFGTTGHDGEKLLIITAMGKTCPQQPLLSL